MKSTLSKIFFAVLATALVVYFFMMVWKLSNNSMSEGFAGPAKVGIPDCLQESSTAAKLYSIVASKKQTTEEGPDHKNGVFTDNLSSSTGKDDLREFALILSKTSCSRREMF